MVNVLVTGCAGYIGSHTVKRLQKRKNVSITVVDDLSTGHRKALRDVAFVRGDIFNQTFLEDVLKRENIDCVIHFAAKSIIGESLANPMVYYENNVSGTLTLLKTMLNGNIKKLVFSSSAAVYGEPANIPVTEDEPLEPSSVYGKTKRIIEGILEDYHHAYGLNYISLRYFNAAGADESGQIGEDHNPETHLIPVILEHVMGKRDNLLIHGVDYPTKDGTCIRDYVHVSDLADAHVLSLDALLRGAKPKIYNLGNEKGFSVKEVIETVQKETNVIINAVESPRRKGDPAVLIACNQKIKRELGWNPTYVNLRDIIRTAWYWHRNNPEGFKEEKEKRDF